MTRRPSPQPTRDEIARPWTREHERNVWHYAATDGAMLCGLVIGGSPLVMASTAAPLRNARKCTVCWRAAP